MADDIHNIEDIRHKVRPLHPTDWRCVHDIVDKRHKIPSKRKYRKAEYTDDDEA